MASALIPRLTLAALLVLGWAGTARALQIGETQTQIRARHGAPGAEDRGKNLAVYYWEGWSAQLEFQAGVVQTLTYKKNWYLQEPEITGLLQSNGGTARWREITRPGTSPRHWVRDDGATAACATDRPLTMTFQNAPPPGAAPQPAPKVVVPATPAGPSSPAIYPKMLGAPAEAEPALKLDDSPLSEAPKPKPAPEIAPAPTPKPLPKLTAEEVEPESAPEPAPVVPKRSFATKPVEPPERPVPGTEALIDPAFVPAPVLDAPEKRSSPPYGLIASMALIGAAAGAYYFLKKKRASAEFAAPSPIVRPAARGNTEVVAVTTPAIDVLRPDQYELIIGEIFRREGYTVEISAAAAQGDSIDLTLRRDSETILVQCKHWKTSRVTEREVREFYGTMTGNGAPRGIFVTAGTFSRDARDFAEGKGIDLMDRAALEECTAAIARPGENFCGITDWVEEFAANARIFDPECPICQGSMVIRNNRANGAAYWSCRNHPRCPGRREPRLDLLSTAAAGSRQ